MALKFQPTINTRAIFSGGWTTGTGNVDGPSIGTDGWRTSIPATVRLGQNLGEYNFPVPQHTHRDVIEAFNRLKWILSRPHQHPIHTTANVPDPDNYEGATIYVSNGAGNAPIMAFSDGVIWRRSDTGTVITNNPGVLGEGGQLRFFTHTLTPTDESNKYWDTGVPPFNLTKVILIIQDAPGQQLGTDYTVTATGRLSWNGLGLAGEFTAGDSFTLIFY